MTSAFATVSVPGFFQNYPLLIDIAILLMLAATQARRSNRATL